LKGQRQIMRRFRSDGRKRRFGAAGVINLLASNLLLQLLLASHSFSIGVATLMAQLFNGSFGYVVYGRWVFQAQTLRRWQPSLLYGVLMVLLWSLNTMGISGLSTAGIGLNRNLAALLMIVPLAAISYSLQKHLVFRAGQPQP
jgi:putative flippase GtrA